jgi:hypothetical protein
MIDKKAQISKLIETLKLFREKPGKFFRDGIGCDTFLKGMVFMAVHVELIDYERYKRLYREVATSYGWTWIANPFYLQMVDQGIEDDQIIDNLMAVEIEVWEKLLDLSTET